MFGWSSSCWKFYIFFCIDYLTSHPRSNLRCNVLASGAERIQNRNHFTIEIMNTLIMKIAKQVIRWGISRFRYCLQSQTKAISDGSKIRAERFWGDNAQFMRHPIWLSNGIVRRMDKMLGVILCRRCLELGFVESGRITGFVCIVEVFASLTGAYRLKMKSAIVHE